MKNEKLDTAKEMFACTEKIKTVHILTPDLTTTIKNVYCVWDIEKKCLRFSIGANTQDSSDCEVTTMLQDMFDFKNSFNIPLKYIYKQHVVLTDENGNDVSQDMINIIKDIYPNIMK